MILVSNRIELDKLALILGPETWKIVGVSGHAEKKKDSSPCLVLEPAWAMVEEDCILVMMEVDVCDALIQPKNSMEVLEYDENLN